jgi:hypothetical protein
VTDEGGVLTISIADSATRRLMLALVVLVLVLVLAMLALLLVLANLGVSLNPEAWVCAVGLVPVGLAVLVAIGRQESVELDGATREVRVVVRTWGRRRVLRLAPGRVTAIRLDALGARTRVAMQLAEGSWPLFSRASRAEAEADAARIAERLGVLLDRDRR